MLAYIEKIRQAPAAERRRIAALATLIIVGIIAFMWMLSLSLSFTTFFDAQPNAATPDNSGIQAPY